MNEEFLFIFKHSFMKNKLYMHIMISLQFFLCIITFKYFYVYILERDLWKNDSNVPNPKDFVILYMKEI